MKTRNYHRLKTYANSFVRGKPETDPLDIVHNLWLKYFDKTGLDLLNVEVTNRFLYLIVRNEYYNNFNRQSRLIYPDTNDDFDDVLPPSVVFDTGLDILLTQDVQTIFLNRLEKMIRTQESNMQNTKNKRFDEEKLRRLLFGIYSLMLLGHTTAEISKIMMMKTPSVTYYKGLIKEALNIS